MADKIGVFISYNHCDRKIATVLKECLTTLSEELHVFVDHSGIEAGDDYERKLAKSISAAQWFLMVWSGPPRSEKDMGYCLYEAGQFRKGLLGVMDESLVRKRLVCIHDDERPKQLAHFQSKRISPTDHLERPLDLSEEAQDTSLFEKTDAYSLFEAILRHSRGEPLRDLTNADIRSLVRREAKRLISAFVEMQSEVKLPEIVLQDRISFLLPAPVGSAPAMLSPETEVVGYESSLSNLFGIVGTQTTWGNIKTACKQEDGNDPLWVNDLEQAAGQVSLGHVPDQPNGMCQAWKHRKLHRVLLARYEPFRSKARICHVAFVPTAARDFDLKQRSSVLLSSLILSVRFQQRILPFIKTLQEQPNDEKLDDLRELERELHLAETEAEAFGLSSVRGERDDPPLVRVFRDGDNKAVIQDGIKSWGKSRRVLMDVFNRVRAPDPNLPRAETARIAAEAAIRELEKANEYNRKYIQLITQELLYVEKIDLERSGAAAGSAKA